ncbi:uncharacterized protein TNCV_2760861 [Trichonephila clavipes]|nr:uncharacterized protein TNCV_2760861 [Trichonephila clavipes]
MSTKLPWELNPEGFMSDRPPDRNIYSYTSGPKVTYTELSIVALAPLSSVSCQVIYSQFGLAIHQNDHEARRRFVEWAQNEIAVVPDFHKRILFRDEAHFWLNGYVNKQNCRIWSEANPQKNPVTYRKTDCLVRFMGWWNHWSVLLQKR